MGYVFGASDLEQIEGLGMTEAQVEGQLANFEAGFPYLHIVSAARIGDGIVRLDGGAEERLAARYNDYLKGGHRVEKFVPASGAATRMFKDLYEFLASGIPNRVEESTVADIERFAFYDELLRELPEAPHDKDIVEGIVGEAGLNYGTLPKGLLLFHRYADEVRTPIEEHLVEGAQYAACDGEVRLHFTVSPEHRRHFEELLRVATEKYGNRFGVRYTVSLSEQAPSTNTIAVAPDNNPFRNGDGSLLFRPAGHGALIENLNAIDADIIFVKNIDNITTDSRRDETILSKQALAGLLVELQERTFGYLRDIDAGRAAWDEIGLFIEERLCIRGAHREEYRELLSRPMRVCGMVRNDGEPGGGPFWVGERIIQLQIAESSQIAPEQRDIMRMSTHFNPVDLVCGVRDYRGRKFDLREFTDPSTGFISEKSKDGRPLKAQELPGLWNGAMANWTTLFVEAPSSTFTPVKVVTDLLRKEHQNYER